MATKEARRRAQRNYYKRHREKVLADQKARNTTPERKEYMREWRAANKDKLKKYDKTRRANATPVQKTTWYLRRRINKIVKGEWKAGSAIEDLGCTPEELIVHLENQFQDGMTWDNQGEWHIDHIKPLCLFDLTDREQFKAACHYTNLQPLWALDNIRKGGQ